MMTKAFLPGFVWGVATSAFQIEGAWNEWGMARRSVPSRPWGSAATR
jgi:beta-glucosidase/6-phospho-beta-glucosidase/beta-galactosidase